MNKYEFQTRINSLKIIYGLTDEQMQRMTQRFDSNMNYKFIYEQIKRDLKQRDINSNYDGFGGC